MSIFNFHKSSDSDTEVTYLARDEMDIQKIEVRDIKQYLVDEYSRARDLMKENEELEEKLEEADAIKLKYDAALVTLDEYAHRLEEYPKKIEQLKTKIEEQKEEWKKEQERCNNLKITMNRMAPEQIVESVFKSCLNAADRIKATSAGNISKSELWDVLFAVKDEQLSEQRKSKEEA